MPLGYYIRQKGSLSLKHTFNKLRIHFNPYFELLR